MLLGLLLTGCAAAPPAIYALSPQAPQRPHPHTVPQLDREGGILTQYQPQRSVFGLALGGTLVDYRQGVARGFQDAFAADFNAVVADPGQPLAALLRAAEGSGVRLLRLGDKADDRNDAPSSPALLDATAVAVIALPRDPARIDAFAAAAATQRDRPVWALLPAHGTAVARMPDPAQTRALAFAAIVHGASGLIWQGADNYAARNAGMFGIAPAPQLDYGIATGAGAARVITPAEAAAAKRLWETAAALNRRIARLAPALLQPDAALAYDLALAPGDDALRQPLAVPVRSLLKPWQSFGEAALLLIAVNLEPRSHAIRVDFGRSMRAMARAPGDESYGELEADAARGLLHDRIEAYGVRLYRLVP